MRAALQQIESSIDHYSLQAALTAGDGAAQATSTWDSQRAAWLRATGMKSVRQKCEEALEHEDIESLRDVFVATSPPYPSLSRGLPLAAAVRSVARVSFPSVVVRIN